MKRKTTHASSPTNTQGITDLKIKKQKKKKSKTKKKPALLAKPKFSTSFSRPPHTRHIANSSSSARSPASDYKFKNTMESQSVVAKYHVLMKEIEKVKSNRTLTDEEKSKKVIEIQERHSISLKLYQEASIFGSKTTENASFNAGLWVKQEIQRLVFSNRNRLASSPKKFYLLDVGAIDNQYIDNPHPDLEVNCIDLNPMGPKVIRYDFFDFFEDYVVQRKIDPALDINLGGYDGIVLSLVVNFIGSPHKRGEMLFKCSHPKLLKKGGLLFIVLPNACIDNSRYFDMDIFTALMKHLNFELVESKITRKLVFATFRLEVPNVREKNFTFPVSKMLKVENLETIFQ